MMKCPNCGHGDHRILRTKEMETGIRRHRECLKCVFRWFTIEVPAAEVERAARIVERFNDLQRLLGPE